MKLQSDVPSPATTTPLWTSLLWERVQKVLNWFSSKHYATEIPPTPRPTPRFLRLFLGRVHKILKQFSFKYCAWTRRPWDNQILPLPFGLLIKYSDGTAIDEVLAMQVARAAGLPVPRVLCYGEHPDTPHAPVSILMTRMPGRELSEVYESLAPEAKATVLSEMKTYVDLMRSWPNPWGSNRICSVSGAAIRSIRVPNHIMGPYDNEQALNQYLIGVASSIDFNPLLEYEQVLATAKELHSIPHKIVFTHGDLLHHNILVHNGHVSAILDWEAAGWLPEYWEFTTAWRFMRPGIWWYDFVSDLGGERYLKEFESEKALMELTDGSYVG